jgi:hypothetical protein
MREDSNAESFANTPRGQELSEADLECGALLPLSAGTVLWLVIEKAAAKLPHSI